MHVKVSTAVECLTNHVGVRPTLYSDVAIISLCRVGLGQTWSDLDRHISGTWIFNSWSTNTRQYTCTRYCPAFGFLSHY